MNSTINHWKAILGRRGQAGLIIIMHDPDAGSITKPALNLSSAWPSGQGFVQRLKGLGFDSRSAGHV